MSPMAESERAYRYSLSDLTDVEIAMVNLDQDVFPDVPSDVTVHQGFHDEQLKTATSILAAVQSQLASTGATSVTCVRLSDY
jgi:hypothetical protein